MSVLTIRLPDNIISKINVYSQKLSMTKAQYIRESIEQMNLKIYNEERKNRFIKASMKTRKQNMLINSEFAAIEYDPKD